MLALLAAAAIAGQTPGATRLILDPPSVVRRQMNCGLWHSVPTAQVGAAPRAKRLGDLPRANWEIAVLRLDANGCQTPVVVSYGVELGGKSAPAETGK